jgi:sugar/nucleoside kinase (ribokinase family)
MKIKQITDPAQCFDLQFPAGKQFDVVGLGQNTIDHYCVLPEFPRADSKTEIQYQEKQAGGQVATALVFVSRIGLKAKYIGKVGSDDHGRLAIESLQRENIDTTSIVMEEGARNHFSFIMVDQRSGERTILWERDRRLNFESGELSRADICAGRILLLDGDDHEAALQAATWANEEGIPVIIDLDMVVPKCRELIAMVDFLIVSRGFPREFTGISNPSEALSALRGSCPGFLATTMGAEGAVAMLGDRCVRFPAFKTHITDTTGAGDIFHGGFLYGLLKDWPLYQIMSFANAAAALNCTRLGARAGIPALADVLQLAQQDGNPHCAQRHK